MKRLAALFLLLTTALAAARTATSLILYDANIWTVDPAHPQAQAIAVAGNRILAVGHDRDILALKTGTTRLIDLKGAMVLPGFIDSHTHFGSAVDAFFTARVVDVSDDTTLAARLREAAARVPAGMWITASSLDAQTTARARKAGASRTVYAPSLATLDAAGGDHPVLIRRWDGTYFANSRALKLAQLTPLSPNPANGEFVKGSDGALTGELRGVAGERVAAILPPHSRARNAIAAQAIVRQLNSLGITSIHDVARNDVLSDGMIFPVDVERSFTSMSIFDDLRRSGKLTLRVYPLLSLAEWRDYRQAGISQGTGDDLIRYGTLKVFADASYMEQPFANQPGFGGGLSYRVTDLETWKADIVGADRQGFDVAVHVMGDKGIRLAMEAFESAAAQNPPRDRRMRLLHLWYPSFDEVDRAGRAHDIVDITPSQLIEQTGTLDALLGPDRAPSAFPWHAAEAAGLVVDIGSDWPGTFDGEIVAPVNPLENIYYAVTRRALPGEAGKAWHPEQALTIDEAIKAYTFNPAYAAHEERVKGSLGPGKLADMVVLSQDIRHIPADQIPQTKVLSTIFDGRFVHD